ncbi:MAG: aminotransferase class I/II-fold pyridoxal phosphate-dependent enzyme [Sphingobacteriales bacterium]|nr:aminotransferase class I/II-fold pyridoxal phosphate-dependent enzyme [Sphingobacteriales bacterium]
MLIQCFCIAGKDKVIILPPSFSMYEHASRVMNIGLIEVMLKEEIFQLNVDEILKQSQDNAAKIIFICSPNNPTGNLMDENDIENILNNFDGLVVIDEAYQDFAENKSWTNRLDEFENLVVINTFSKAWGMADARLGNAVCK